MSGEHLSLSSDPAWEGVVGARQRMVRRHSQRARDRILLRLSFPGSVGCDGQKLTSDALVPSRSPVRYASQYENAVSVSRTIGCALRDLHSWRCFVYCWSCRGRARSVATDRASQRLQFSRLGTRGAKRRYTCTGEPVPKRHQVILCDCFTGDWKRGRQAPAGRISGSDFKHS